MSAVKLTAKANLYQTGACGACCWRSSRSRCSAFHKIKKNVAGYVPFEFKGKQISICIHQMRIISQRRVLARKGKISDKRLKEVKTEIKFFLIYDVKKKKKILNFSLQFKLPVITSSYVKRQNKSGL